MSTQPITLPALIEERKALQLRTFDYSFAWELGRRIRERAVSASLPVAIEVRHGMDVIFATLVGDATIDNFDWTRRKAAVAHRFHRSSLEMRLEAEKGGFDFNSRFRLPEADFVASGGAVPLVMRDGLFIGAVAVSGLPDVEDHQLAVDTLKTLVS